MITILFYRDRQKKWRWNAKAANGRKIANCGEGYNSQVACARGFLAFAEARIVAHRGLKKPLTEYRREGVKK